MSEMLLGQIKPRNVARADQAKELLAVTTSMQVSTAVEDKSAYRVPISLKVAR